MQNNYTIIMAGGVGSRFWPMSKSDKPKQFLDILGTGKSLIQLTYERLLNTCPNENIYIVTSNEYFDLCKNHLPSLPIENILTEPDRKNTAPCVAYGCYKIYQKNPDAKILVAPSDHLILKENNFIKTINNCFTAANDDILITLGIEPTRPETGYGYIESGKIEYPNFSFLQKVTQFKEKPNLEKAKEFLAQGNFYWNSGMFIWSAKAIVEAFKNHSADLHEIFNKGMQSFNSANEKSFVDQAYQACPNISVDYAILEKANNIYVYPCDLGWTDLGTWGSLYTLQDKDENQNAKVGNFVEYFESSDNLVVNTQQKLVVVEGLHDYIVVNSDDVLLICKKQNEQNIKQIVEELKGKNQLKSFI